VRSGPFPLVIAHRGASSIELENSLAAFRAAAPQGADGVELDIHATADGELIVHHDETIDGTHIAQSTARAIAALRLKNGEPVPTLAQALAAIAPRLQVFIEVKTLEPRWDPRLFEAMDRGPNPTGYAIHSFDHRIIRRLGDQRRGGKLRCGVLSSSYPVRPLAALDDAAASILWQERTMTDDLLVRTLHDARRSVFVWTVDEPADLARFVALGVDGLCTNFPARARQAVDTSRAA
jgi:glycerophosphoryl diester phosphodiesterase